MKTEEPKTPLVEYQVEELILKALFSTMLDQGKWLENGELYYDCLNQRLTLDDSKIRQLLHEYGTTSSVENGPQTFKKELQNIINQAVHKNRAARLLGPLIDATQWKLNFETAELANIRTSKTDEDVNDNPVCKSNKSKEPVCGSSIRLPTKFKGAQRINDQMQALQSKRPKSGLSHLFLLLAWQRDLTRLSISIGLAIACFTQGILTLPMEWRIFGASTSIATGLIKEVKSKSLLSPLQEIRFEFEVSGYLIKSQCYIPTSYRMKVNQEVEIEFTEDDPEYARIVGAYHNPIDTFVLYTIIVFIVISYLTKASIIRGLNYARILSEGRVRLARIISHKALGDIDRIIAITRYLPTRQSQARLVELEYEHLNKTINLQVMAHNLSDSVNENHKVILIDPQNPKLGVIVDDLNDFLTLNPKYGFELSSCLQYDKIIAQLGFIPLAWFLFGYGLESFFAMISNSFNALRENLLKL